MATADQTTWDRQISELRESMSRFQNPIAKDIVTHCVGLAQDAYNLERNINPTQQGSGKEASYNTSR